MDAMQRGMAGGESFSDEVQRLFYQLLNLEDGG